MCGVLPLLPLILPVLLTVLIASVIRVTVSSRSSCACSAISSDTPPAWMTADDAPHVASFCSLCAVSMAPTESGFSSCVHSTDISASELEGTLAGGVWSGMTREPYPPSNTDTTRPEQHKSAMRDISVVTHSKSSGPRSMPGTPCGSRIDQETKMRLASTYVFVVARAADCRRQNLV